MAQRNAVDTRYGESRASARGDTPWAGNEAWVVFVMTEVRVHRQGDRSAP